LRILVTLDGRLVQGSVAAQVVQSGVAPVLLVRPSGAALD